MRLATSSSRSLARHELRKALRLILVNWSGLPDDQLPLHETAHGPVWNGRLAGETLDISLSHSDGESWIGLVLGGKVGVDVVRANFFPEMNLVADDFLGPEVTAQMKHSANPARTFALAWAELEAQIKCLKQALIERGKNIRPKRNDVQVWKRLFENETVVAVAAIMPGLISNHGAE
jgi:4'-phosphopantetheinyl transferase